MTTEEREKLIAATVAEHPDWSETNIAEGTGIPRSTVRMVLDRLKIVVPSTLAARSRRIPKPFKRIAYAGRA